MSEIKNIALGYLDEPLDKPFILKFSKERSGDATISTNVFADTCAAELGIQPDALPASERFETTGGLCGELGQTADTSFDGM